MDIIIESPGFKAGPELEGFVNEKVAKLEHHLPTIVRADVTLFNGPDSEAENAYCEIRLEVPGNDYFVKKNCENFELAVVDAVNTLDNLIKKKKEQQYDRRP
jgi:putative sigma-54 modulation protein